MVLKVVHYIRRTGDVGEPGWTVNYEELPYCTYSGSRQWRHCATQHPSITSCFPASAYITESARDVLTSDELSSISDRIIGVVSDEYAYSTGPHYDPTFGRNYYCWELNEYSIISEYDTPPANGDTMTATHIPDETIVCFYGDILAKIGGWNGIDHLIVDRDDGGPNIWSSNFTVGVCNDDETDETDGDEYKPKSELATDLSAIFGDIDTKWIIIGVIALIILGLLSG